MTSARQIAANRRNAQRSTGPRTSAGKARARANALKHGLSRPIAHDPAFNEQVGELAAALAGGAVDGAIPELARQAADAQLEVLRVRLARLEMIREGIGWVLRDEKEPFRGVSDVMLGAFLETRSEHDLEAVGLQLLRSRPDPARSAEELTATGLTRRVRMFELLERYERRAMSRRKFAIRALEAALVDAGIPSRP